MLSKEATDRLMNIPSSVLIELNNIYQEKSRVVREQRYEEAAKLRDKEKQHIRNNNLPEELLQNHSYTDIINIIRDRKIDIINE